MPINKVNQQVNVATESSTIDHNHDHHRHHDHDRHDHHRDHDDDVKEIETKLMATWLKWLLPFLITALLAGIASIYDRVQSLEKGTFHNELIDHRLKTLESYHDKEKDK